MLLDLNSIGGRAGQPAAEFLCFWGFRAMAPFIVGPGGEKRGGAGRMLDRGESDSGNNVSTEATKERARSDGEIGEGCEVLW